MHKIIAENGEQAKRPMARRATGRSPGARQVPARERSAVTADHQEAAAGRLVAA
jgi:hypothetical protein